MGIFKSKSAKMYEKCMETYYYEYFSMFYERRLLSNKLKRLNSNQADINKEHKENANKTSENFVLAIDKWFTDHISSMVLSNILSTFPVDFNDSRAGIQIFAEYYLTNKDLTKFKGLIPTCVEEFNDPTISKYFIEAKDGRKSDSQGYLNYLNEFKRLNKEIDTYSEKIQAMCKIIIREYNHDIEKALREQISKDIDEKIESEGCKNG